jgi:hypothetical protein
MKELAAFPFALVLGVTTALGAGAQAEPTEITKCETISQPGSYVLDRNLTDLAAIGDCLVISADSVTIDLGGFSITGQGGGVGIRTIPPAAHGIAVRNGSISRFLDGVNLKSVDGAIVENLRVFHNSGDGIIASGIVRGNSAVQNLATGIVATGTVTGNVAFDNFIHGIEADPGSTVIANTVLRNKRFGLFVQCPSNVTGNTAVDNGTNLAVSGTGCHIEDNVAP